MNNENSLEDFNLEISLSITSSRCNNGKNNAITVHQMFSTILTVRPRIDAKKNNAITEKKEKKTANLH